MFLQQRINYLTTMMSKKMKLQDILKDILDDEIGEPQSVEIIVTELNERSDVKEWLRDLVKSYQSYYKPAQKFKTDDIIQALGGKKRLLLLYRRGMAARKAAIYLAKTPPADKKKGVKWY